MDHLQKLRKQFRSYIFIWFTAVVLIAAGVVWVIIAVLDLSSFLALGLAVLIGVCSGYYFAAIASKELTKPVEILWQAILHVSPEHVGTAAPNLQDTRTFGKELVTSLSLQVYQLASGVMPSGAKTSEATVRSNNILNSLPMPIMVMDKGQNIVMANEAAEQYLGINSAELLGRNMYSVLDLAFPSEETFDKWLSDTKTKKAVDTKSWERVRLKLPDAKTVKQFDLAAYYSKDNPSGFETILALFDHTETYSKDDESINFVALAVHELRLPLTMLRGYIDVFEEELEGKLSPELSDFMHKMQASGQRLTALVNNILNVSRIEQDQMVLQLNEDNLADIIKSVGKDYDLRAKIHGKTIEYDIADNLPTVGVDRVSLYEILGNLMDNAIKYSVKSDKILVKSRLTSEGVIETTVRDFGVGIAESVIPHLFERFYRSHRTQRQIGGTGLGLYLCKALVEAHGGNIWVRSKEGEGATFGFTLLPYVMVAHKLKTSDNKDIVRGAHGWIKNHSLYRR